MTICCKGFARWIPKATHKHTHTLRISNTFCCSIAKWLHGRPSMLRCRLRLKCDGTRAETRFGLSAKRTSPFRSAGASVQSTTVGRSVRISGSTAGYTMFRGSVKGTGYPLHSPVSPSLTLPCVTVCASTVVMLDTPCSEVV